VASLRETVRELKARLGLDSRNSSKPPSSDPPGKGGAAPGRRRTGRKRGGQPGHVGKTREPFREDQIDRRVHVRLERCHHCDASLRGAAHDLVAPVRHQVVEIPAAAAFVTEYVLERARCPRCGVVTRAPLPQDVGRGMVGLRLQAVAALLVGRFRLTRREGAQLLQDLYGAKARIATGTLSALEARSQAALAPCYQEVAEAVCNAEVVHADETTFGRRPTRKWLWTACTGMLSFFRIDDERSRRAFQKLLPGYKGILVTDRYGAYDSHPPLLRQNCWAHIKRDFQALVDRGPPAAPAGYAGLRACREITRGWSDLQAGRLQRAGLARRLGPTRDALKNSLERYRHSPDRKTRALCGDLLRRWSSLWTFLRRDGVAPTNNLAEREIRPAVIWRKTCFGCRSRRGERFVATMLTVTRTLRNQSRGVLEFLVASLRAHQMSRPHPSLLPP